MSNKRMWRGIGTLAVTLLFLGCGGSSPRVSPPFVAVHNTLTAMGLSQTGQISEGSLEEGAIARFRTSLVGGSCYTFVAFGDGSVSNLDVLVLDDAGTERARDDTVDAQAAAHFCADADGTFQVAVRMTQGSGGYVVSSWSGGVSGGGGGGGGARAGGNGGSCDNPIALTPGTPVQGDTTQGPRVLTGRCLMRGAREVQAPAPEQVYVFELSERSQIRAVLQSDYDGALYLLSNCRDPRSEIACNDDSAPGMTTRSHIATTLDAGTYYLVVDGFGDASGHYELVLEAQPLANVSEVCGQAPQVQAGQPVTGSTDGQANYFQATCAGGARSPDRVYQLSVPQRSRMRVRQQSDHDGAIYVRSSCADPNSEVACNDDYGDTRHSVVTATVDPGTYYIYTDGFGEGNAGNYSFLAELAPAAGGNATGDACGAPGTIAAGSQVVQIDTFQARDDFSGSCGGQGGADVVYRIDATGRTRLTATPTTSEFAPLVMYLQGTCGNSSTESTCAVIGGRGGSDNLSVDLAAGTYYLVVDSNDPNAFGALEMRVETQDLAALERSCRAAPQLQPGRTVQVDTSGGADNFRGSCAGAGANDSLYRLVLRRRSRVRIRSEQQYDGAIYIRRTCVDASSELACNDDAPPPSGGQPDNRHSQLETVLDAGTYYVVVDGFAQGEAGSSNLQVEISNP